MNPSLLSGLIPPLANNRWPKDVAVVLLLVDRQRHNDTCGSFIALTRKQLEDGCAFCGIRADAVWVLDKDLSPEVLLDLKCALAANADIPKLRRYKGDLT